MKVVSGSKNIAAIDFHQYEGAEVGTLTTQFANGRSYAYLNVPSAVYDELVREVDRTDADASVGKAFNRLVRSADFEYEEITA